MGPGTSASASRFANGSLDSCEELETDSAKLSKKYSSFDFVAASNVLIVEDFCWRK
jgi:7-keto-8-aminopelargonate synthetase-like enzyme